MCQRARRRAGRTRLIREAGPSGGTVPEGGPESRATFRACSLLALLEAAQQEGGCLFYPVHFCSQPLRDSLMEMENSLNMSV